MVAKLREKPGGADLNIVIGDFCDVAVDGPCAGSERPRSEHAELIAFGVSQDDP